ncbi:hypothetical protein CFC21_058876 [Triticum aestivum]|uniref:DUF7597 domain-containing protein n=2 Tax=Triticum aestivum TaxID=4565 RepID=A0A9R1GN08_WHEAT|nr:hypothetical protein CFC21_058876 [Triticum aestivum]
MTSAARAPPLSDQGSIPPPPRISPTLTLPATNPQPILATAVQNSALAPMATFPFDPTPFVPRGFSVIEVADRPARARVVYGDFSVANEDLAIVTILPMPLDEVPFVNVRDVLGDFLSQIKRVGFKSITPCPFGQAFVRFNSVAERDLLVDSGPHRHDDIHYVLQKHNQGLNWKKIHLDREVCLLLVGFPADLRCIQELANFVRSFGKMSVWDRVKSSDAAVLIKFYVDALKEIPASIVVSSDKKEGESWTCHVVIIHDSPVGEGPPEEDHIPVDGNPHPRPDEEHHHPNQNMVIGPFLDVHNHNQVAGNQQNNNIQEEEQDAMYVEYAGWGHWAMPNEEQLIDQELHAGEFLELNDLLAPVNEESQLLQQDPEESDITLSLNNAASSAEFFTNGPANVIADLLAPLQLNLPDLNLVVQVQDIPFDPIAEEVRDHVPVLVQHIQDFFDEQHVNVDVAIAPQVHVAIENVDVAVAPSDVAIPNTFSSLAQEVEVSELQLVALLRPDTSQLDLHAIDNVNNPALPAADSTEAHDSQTGLHLLEHAQPATLVPFDAQQEQILEQHSTSVLNKVVALQELSNLVKIPIYYQKDQGTTPSAPPGFPLPIYQGIQNNITVGAMQFLFDVADPVFQKMLPDLTDSQILGKEGASIWNTHFAPSLDTDKVVQVPIEWTNFLSLALLSPEKFE